MGESVAILCSGPAFLARVLPLKLGSRSTAGAPAGQFLAVAGGLQPFQGQGSAVMKGLGRLAHAPRTLLAGDSILFYLRSPPILLSAVSEHWPGTQ